ncbi:MAG: CRTAC1 family protein [Verrucomicrobiia bacterium]
MNNKCFFCKIAALGAACLALALVAVAVNRHLTGRAAGSTPLPIPALAVIPPIPAGPDDLFEDVTIQAGIQFVNQFCDTKIANIIESNGAGGCWLDYDGDGYMDLFLVNSGPLDGVTHHAPGTARVGPRLYRNRGDGTFEDVTEKAGLGGLGYCTAAVAGDYDNDGHTDLYVVGVGRSYLFHNRGDGTFEDVTEKAGVGNIGGTGIGAVFFDADNDGKLDLFVANYLTFDPSYQLYYNPDAYPGPLSYKPQFNKLYHNRGDGTFEDVSKSSGIEIPGHRAMSVAMFDYNNDGAPDLYISDDGTPNLLLVNDGKGHFQDRALQAGVAFNAMGEAAGSMAATIGDCNNDGIEDILVTRLGYGSLYMGTTNGIFDDRMMASGLGSLTAQFVGWGGCFLDYDNSGKLDIFIANGDPHYLVGWESLLLENRGDGTFTDAAARGGAYFKTKINARGSAVADYNNDGHMDIIVTTIGNRPFLLRNRDKSGNHWITLDLEGTKSNRDGFGAKVKVTAGGKTYFAEARCASGFLMQSDRRPHFGLGQATNVDRIEILWPSKQVQELTNVKVDQILKVREPGERQ